MLCRLVREAGLTMTLHGVPVLGPGELRTAALESVADRFADAIANRPRCICTYEGGDSGNCPAHPTCDECGTETKVSVRSCEEHR